MEGASHPALRCAENLTLPRAECYGGPICEAQIQLSRTLSSSSGPQDKLEEGKGLAVQVIVMSANMGCCHCRQRVSRIISKINGLLDYVVDVRNKEVIVRGAIDSTGGANAMHLVKSKLLDGEGFSNDVRLPHKSTRFFSAFKDMCSASCFCAVKTT